MSDPTNPEPPQAGDPFSPSTPPTSGPAWSSADAPLPPIEPPAAAGAPPFPPAAAGGSSIPTAPAPGSASDPAASEEKSAPGWKAWIAAGAVAAVVAVGAGFVLGNSSDGGSNTTAAASPNGTANGALPGGYGQFRNGGPIGAMGTAGTVSAVDGSTLTVTSTDGTPGSGTTTTVKTTDDTVVTKSSEGELRDLALGDNVMVMGQTDGDAVAAQRIVDSGAVAATTGRTGGPAGGGAPDGQTPPAGVMMGAPTAGEITKIDGDTITVKTSDGTIVTVTTSSATVISITETIEVSDIAKGDTVMVAGETSDDVVTATSIRVGDLEGGFRMNGGTPPDGATPPNGAAPGTSSSSSSSPGTVTGT